MPFSISTELIVAISAVIVALFKFIAEKVKSDHDKSDGKILNDTERQALIVAQLAGDLKTDLKKLDHIQRDMERTKTDIMELKFNLKSILKDDYIKIENGGPSD